MPYLFSIPTQTVYGQVCGVFQLLAQRTWSDLEDGHRLGLAVSEESITDFLLLHLKKTLPNNIFIQKFSKPVEGKTTGADWEWWFVGHGRAFGMRVQAKRLSIQNQRYEELGRRVGKKSKTRQVDLLIRNAKKFNLYATYCFYNFWDSHVSPPNWKCGSFSPDWRMFGCAVADAVAIKRLISKGQDDLQSVANDSLPWSCLVCCEGFRVNQPDSLADRVRNLVAGVLLGARDARAVLQRPVPEVVEAGQWPNYLRTVLEGPAIEVIERPENRDIDGVLAVRIE